MAFSTPLEFSVWNIIFATFSETTENNPLPATAVENGGLKWWQGCEMELSGLRGEAAAAGGSGQFSSLRRRREPEYQ